MLPCIGCCSQPACITVPGPRQDPAGPFTRFGVSREACYVKTCWHQRGVCETRRQSGMLFVLFIGYPRSWTYDPRCRPWYPVQACMMRIACIGHVACSSQRAHPQPIICPSEKGPVSGGHLESTARAHRDQRRGIRVQHKPFLTVCVSQPAYHTEHKHPPREPYR